MYKILFSGKYQYQYYVSLLFNIVNVM